MKFENTVKELIKKYNNKDDIQCVLFTIPEDVYDNSLELTYLTDLFKYTTMIVDDVLVYILVSSHIKEFDVQIIEKEVKPIKFYPYDNILVTKDVDMNVTIKMVNKFPKINE